MSQERTSAASTIGSLAIAATAGFSSASASSITWVPATEHAVALRRVAGVVALRLVGDGGDQLGGGTVVAQGGPATSPWPTPP